MPMAIEVTPLDYPGNAPIASSSFSKIEHGYWGIPLDDAVVLPSMAMLIIPLGHWGALPELSRQCPNSYKWVQRN